MMCMCLGTMLTLLYQSRLHNSDKIRDICDGVFSSYDLKISDFPDASLPGHLKSGHDAVPRKLYEAARDSDMEETIDAIDRYLIKLINPDKRAALVRAIKRVLADDPCSNETPIFITPGYEKGDILKAQAFDLSALLANVLTYSITVVKNEECKVHIKSIPKDFIDQLIKADDPVVFPPRNVDQDTFSPIKRSIKDSRFNKVFTKAIEANLPVDGCPSCVSMYYLIPQNCKFRYRDLKEFVVNNIGNYVFSRNKAKAIVDRAKNESAVGSQAMLKFYTQYGQSAETVLGEILLYIFLEQVLDAPKVMTSMEIDNSHWNTVSKSRGVHLLTAEKSGRPYHQLVFGASDVKGNISIAIDKVFSSIAEIESNYDNEMRMVEGAAQWVLYNQEQISFLLDLLKPVRGRSYSSDMSFGAFIGYTVKLDQPVTDSDKHREAIRLKLIEDIKAIVPYVQKKIEQYNLQGHSFYFYVFPFNDADNDKSSIIEELLSGGDV